MREFNYREELIKRYLDKYDTHHEKLGMLIAFTAMTMTDKTVVLMRERIKDERHAR